MPFLSQQVEIWQLYLNTGHQVSYHKCPIPYDKVIFLCQCQSITHNKPDEFGHQVQGGISNIELGCCNPLYFIII